MWVISLEVSLRCFPVCVLGLLRSPPQVGSGGAHRALSMSWRQGCELWSSPHLPSTAICLRIPWFVFRLWILGCCSLLVQHFVHPYLRWLFFKSFTQSVRDKELFANLNLLNFRLYFFIYLQVGGMESGIVTNDRNVIFSPLNFSSWPFMPQYFACNMLICIHVKRAQKNP